MKTTPILLAFLALSTLLGGCVHREFVAFGDHSSQPLTSLGVVENTSYLVSGTSEFITYTCAEKGSQLVCKRLCGGNTDLVCPTAYVNGNSVATNIQ